MLKKILSKLVSAGGIGAIVSLFFIGLAFQYYLHREDFESQQRLWMEILSLVDMKTTDLRMKIRGFSSIGDSPVAVLTVDERAVEEVGRWPWSRDTTAKVVARLSELGAKVIGYDMVFAEPEKNIAYRALESIKGKFTQNPEVLRQIEQEGGKYETDRIFGETLKKHQNKMVLGTYFDPNEVYLSPFQELCYNEVFKRSPTKKGYDQEQSPLVVIDDDNMAVDSEVFGEPLKAIFDAITGEVQKAALSKAKKSRVEDLSVQDQANLDREINTAINVYCANWLHPKRDPNYQLFKSVWPQLTQKIDFLKNLDPDQSMATFKNSQLAIGLPSEGRWWINVPPITEGAIHFSFFNASIDSDGTIRRANLIRRIGSHYFPSLPLQSYLVATNQQAQVFLKRDEKRPDTKVIGEFRIVDSEGEKQFSVPVDGQGRLLINYMGSRQMFPYLSAADVFSDSPTAKISVRQYNAKHKAWEIGTQEVDKAKFIKDKIFIFGATAIGIYDLRVTPFEENFPGVETHANVLHNLLTRKFLTSHHEEEIRMLLSLLLIGVVMSMVLHHAGPLTSLLTTVALLLGISLLDQLYIFKKGYVVSIMFPFVMTLSIYVAITIFKYFTEERKKRELKGTFAKYVSPAIVDEILADPKNINLGGKKMRVTVFFSDVRGFTTISEKLDPEQLSMVLNMYLTPMTELVFANKGTLDKYMGDAIMAFFGAPIGFSDHAHHACRCALQNIAKLKELKEVFKAKNLPQIDIGIGLNTAEVSVGNMGSDIVRNYTIMGDGVNLGSRLEGINKEYGTRIIISQFTYEDVKKAFR